MSIINVNEGSVLVVDKPLEWTSFDVVNKIRHTLVKHLHKFKIIELGTKRKIKVGHAGTLDPLATGVLVVCIGKETKNIDAYMASEKEYTGTFFLGATTASYDRETQTENEADITYLNPETIYATTAQFTGVLQQLPPMHSAIKKDGKRLYESARAGEEVELTPRTVEIKQFEITQVNLPFVDFKVICSKGTYIRSLAHDFGKALGCGAYLYALCRTRSGNFEIKDALTVEQVVQIIETA
ncbi:MAG: tRNA pseudouridine(55) synthase TruB [Bacteroidota bacterium]|jgi:tRNA pseudouridine55 synthase